MISMKSYANVVVRAVLSSLPKPGLSGFRVAILCWIVFTACTPNSIQPSIPNAQSPNVSSGTGASEINKALATLALPTASTTADYRVGPEDLLEITLFNVPEALSTERQLTPRTLMVRVNHQGLISLPLIGELEAKGLTVLGLEKRLRDVYDKYIYNPQVGVLIKEFRQRASVIGAVQKPGVFELTGPKSVIELLAMAGGVTEKAGSQVHIYRQQEKGGETHVIDLAVLANSVGLINANNASMINMPVQPGDMINVPEAGMFFVDGAVQKPGSYALGRRYSLSQALATAGGVNVELNSNDISILRRRAPGDMQTIALNLNDVMNGSVPDPQIQPDDVIVVPTSTAKYIVKRFIGSLVGGVSIGSLIGGS
jgi:polysaccharide export outer membrane protein